MEATNSKDFTVDNERGSNVTGLLIAGGDGDFQVASVEVYVPSTGYSCSLPSLPHYREDHTMTGMTVCGGAGLEGLNQDLLTSCITFLSGEWVTSHTLGMERTGHTSWASPQGTILMGGGSIQFPNVGFTSEILVEDGTSVPTFHMKYDTWDVCSIDDPVTNTVVLTGGVYTETVVSLYGEEGWLEDLPSLNQGRIYHACAAYYRDDGARVMLVTGGELLATPLDSTELLVQDSHAWQFSSPLPRTLALNKAVTLDNIVYNTGGYDVGYRDEILRWDDTEKVWVEEATMKTTRGAHAVGLINMGEDALNYCQ